MRKQRRPEFDALESRRPPADLAPPVSILILPPIDLSAVVKAVRAAVDAVVTPVLNTPSGP